MNKRAALIALGVAALLLALLVTARRYGLTVIPGEVSLAPQSEETVTLPEIKSPVLPTYKNPIALWRQSTGLMCACDRAPYTAPILVMDIDIPLAPTPGYVYHPPSTQAIAATPSGSYHDFVISNSFTFWSGPPTNVWYASDGRIFLKSGRSNSLATIGTDEYTTDAQGNIHYGPYTYRWTSPHADGSL